MATDLQSRALLIFRCVKGEGTTIERKVKMVRALERGLQVLAEIERRQGANLHELHLALGLPKATLLRMVVTLGKHGHIWQRLRRRRVPAELHPRAVAARRAPHSASPRPRHRRRICPCKLSEQVAWPRSSPMPRPDHVEIVETNSPLLRLDAITLGPVGSRLSYHPHLDRPRLSGLLPMTGEREAIVERLRPAGR